MDNILMITIIILIIRFFLTDYVIALEIVLE